ncbi:protein O-GlcNAcase isoform X2 [Chrysoperla carnea]|uniref:protein O-GlcNAcase isoform X2 n=1 Tax=Chrysoperla carnea TaxID=189513 RepID=UPI001D08796B|nr:protein O-GlcNAcase isoform X2 [Chrysoperla carnea]
MAETPNQPVENLNTKNGNFICGVVEGFYGRPWTTEQRKDLFQKLKKWGMDSYVYAPKDDYKHRAYWRELYTVEEAEHLTGLINAAKEQGVVFYYALSPGLDITYSSIKEVGALKRKLEQVSQFGCTAFALLFDDIEPEMSEADKEVFQSFAHAQVSITNEVFQHLGQPRFLLCPTQYCSTRAMPNVTNSEYLNTLGSKLAQEIDIMWTGPRVISRLLTLESIQEITDVLRRPPVIWDNLHANDYDQKRVFLGPYSGRSPDLIPKLRGVLTNPNCEYGANFVAIHTLAQWSRCNVDGKRDLSLNDTVSADIKLETETEDGGEAIPTTLSPNTYHPRRALRNAITEWLTEFSRVKSAWGPIAKPQPVVAAAVPVPIIPSINTCMSLTTATTTTCTSSAGGNTTSITSLPVVNTTQLHALAEVCSNVTGNDSFINPIPGPVMNSLVSETKVVCNDSIPNPITPTVIPLPLSAITNTPDPTAKLPIISGTHIKLENHKSDATNDATKNGLIETQQSTDAATNETSACNGKNNGQHDSADELSPSSSLSPTEPMDCNSSTPMSSPAHVTKVLSSTEDVAMSENVSSCSGSMQVETSENTTPPSNTNLSNTMIVEASGDKTSGKELTEEDLSLLCDLFYLPFEHGGQALQLLQEFNWLKSNAHVVIQANQSNDPNAQNKPEVQEWFARSNKMNEMCLAVNRLFEHLTYCNNRELLYDLYAYVWDMRGVVSLLNSYVKWLALGKFPSTMPSFTQGTYTWFSKGWKETFMSGEQEPWVFRGGLTSDLQRLIPVDSGNDLFIYKAPEVPSSKIYTIRPYTHADEAGVYAVCHKTCKDGLQITENLPEIYQDLAADRILGPYLVLNPELCMVVEDESGIVGYGCAALDSRKFRTKQSLSWIPEMCLKYPKPDDISELSKFVQESLLYFHNFREDLDILTPQHPSEMICSLLPSVLDQSISKRLVTCLLAALRANGFYSAEKISNWQFNWSFGVHVSIPQTDTYTHSLYSKLGFVEIIQDNSLGRTYMGRIF